MSANPKKYAPDVLTVMIVSLPTISLNQIGKTKEEYDSGGDNHYTHNISVTRGTICCAWQLQYLNILTISLTRGTMCCACGKIAKCLTT